MAGMAASGQTTSNRKNYIRFVQLLQKKLTFVKIGTPGTGPDPERNR
jgi:hypothetical protein